LKAFLISIYCKTTDTARIVGEAICKANSTEDLSWKIIDESEADTCTIQTNCDGYAHALLYRIGLSIVAVEVNDDCAPNIVEPLMGIYGFENIKWLVTPEKDNV
jgi:hypothetical protein